MSNNTINFSQETVPSMRRLTKYLDFSNGNRENAVRLYRWNTAIGSAFYGPLQTLEITLREKIDLIFTDEFGENWDENLDLGLDLWSSTRIQECKTRFQSRDKIFDPRGFLWDLSFGFWIKLFDSGGEREAPLARADYEATLWRPALRRVFLDNPLLTRREIYGQLNSLRRLRNHIAHHEPIFHRGLKSDYQTILRVLSWMSPFAEQWVVDSSRVLEVLKQRKSHQTIKF